MVCVKCGSIHVDEVDSFFEEDTFVRIYACLDCGYEWNEEDWQPQNPCDGCRQLENTWYFEGSESSICDSCDVEGKEER